MMRREHVVFHQILARANYGRLTRTSEYDLYLDGHTVNLYQRIAISVLHEVGYLRWADDGTCSPSPKGSITLTRWDADLFNPPPDPPEFTADDEQRLLRMCYEVTPGESS